MKSIKDIKKEIEYDFSNAPNVIHIKNNNGIYRRYVKLSYYARNIIYASYGYGIDLKHYTYKELQFAIINQEVEL